jgi:hypothetical protein
LVECPLLIAILTSALPSQLAAPVQFALHQMAQPDRLRNGCVLASLLRLILACLERRDHRGPHQQNPNAHDTHHSHPRMKRITSAVTTKLRMMSRPVVISIGSGSVSRWNET